MAGMISIAFDRVIPVAPCSLSQDVKDKEIRDLRGCVATLEGMLEPDPFGDPVPEIANDLAIYEFKLELAKEGFIPCRGNSCCLYPVCNLGHKQPKLPPDKSKTLIGFIDGGGYKVITRRECQIGSSTTKLATIVKSNPPQDQTNQSKHGEDLPHNVFIHPPVEDLIVADLGHA